jgi:hypothetical protein
VLGLSVALLLGIGGRAAAGGEGSPPLPFPVVNGEVRTGAFAGSTLYLGGSFSRIGTATGTFASLSSGSAHAAALPRVDDVVYEVASDRRGGWFISGVFRTVGGSARPGLGHIRANGTLDAAFHPAVSQPHALAVSPDGSTLYLNCDLQSGGASHIDVIDAGTGVVRRRLRTTDAISQLVASPSGKRLYAAGVFRNGPGVEVISPTTGKDLRWLHGHGRTTSIALSHDGETLYAIHGDGGSHWGGHLTAWSTVTYRKRWEKGLTANGHPLALVLSGDGRTLYTGGTFTKINAASRARLAAFRTSNGSLTPFDVGATGHAATGRDDVGTVYALGISKSTLYVGGTFTSLGGASRYGLGAIDTAKRTVTGWAPEPNSFVDALAVGGHGTKIGVGGGFNAMASISRDRLASVDLNTDSVTAFAPDFSGGDAIDSMVLSPDHSTLYVGGSFTTADGADRSGVAAFSTSDGTLTSFDPDIKSATYALAISPDGSTLYASGNGHKLQAISTSTGATIWSVSAGDWWDSSIAASPDGSTVYVSQVNATPSLFALTTSTGDPVPGFNPPAVSTGGTGAIAISPDGLTVYSGDVGFDAATGTPTFAPTVDGAVNATALSADGTHFFIGGILASVDGVPRSALAEIDLSDGGQVTSLDPEMTGPDNGVEMLATQGSTLVAGGSFSLAGQGHLNLAGFAIP